MKRIVAALAAVFLSLCAPSVSALTVTVDTGNGGVNPTAVLTVSKGNDIKAGVVTAALLDFINSFETPDFALIRADDVFKVDDPHLSASLNFTALDGAPGGETRHFTWTTEDAYKFVVFKAGKGFVAHFYATGLTSNTVTTSKGISHLTFIVPTTIPSIVTPTPVPLPAGGVLLLSALSVLVWRRRRG
ncbi:hypothetical protein [Pacificoceanicola onchidii]|uniref:hypothetical protein n=1 Tax=Pacificoceanicola onchidii TaxID=2562685 RepID=UPI0010A63629|nr:hypothetical protein [Pacificoceanicola onchidii]